MEKSDGVFLYPFLYPFLACLSRADGLFSCLQGGGYANGIQNPGHHR
nr:MAG TPA: hypothetical protein [Caudoviricetes sp.]